MITLLLAIVFITPIFAQKHAIVAPELRNRAVLKPAPSLEAYTFEKPVSTTMKSVKLTPAEENIGITRYDDQSNSSMQNRMYLFDDGTIGATWIFGMVETAFADRGAGYNYFDGSSWMTAPSSRVEDERCGWPSYAPLGETGEVIVSHTAAAGYKISQRDIKGTGDWNYSLFPGPAGHEVVIWNRSITSGVDHSKLHILSLTASDQYSGTPYEGLNGALLYSYSIDGGQTWEMQNEILDGMTSDDYYGFTSDVYTWAEPKGENLAFVVGESWLDLFLMKSTDGGESFEKTVIWENPYPLFNVTVPTVTDTFYCADGASSVVIDNSGKVHVAFGINRAYADDAGTYWFPYVDGIAYWNEDMSTFSNDLNALNPYGDPASELIEDYNLIAWSQDVDNDGVVTFADDYGTYYLGISSMPQLVCGQQNQLYLIYSSMTETFTNGTTNYRHLWARVSPDNGIDWGEFHDLTSDIVHIFDECVYPSCAANSDDNIYLVYQRDTDPGNAAWTGQHPYVDNSIVFMAVDKDEITAVNENKEVLDIQNVSQNQPNPFNGKSQVQIILNEATDMTLKIATINGQQIYQTNRKAHAGLNSFTINAEGWPQGIYFYTVTAGDVSVTKKMVIN